MLELDVGVTKDGKVVVSHDTTLDRTTNGKGTIASRTLRQIRRLDGAYWFAAGDDAYRHDRRRARLPAARDRDGQAQAAEGLHARRLPRADARAGAARVPATRRSTSRSRAARRRRPTPSTSPTRRRWRRSCARSPRRDLIVVSFRQQAVDRFHALAPAIPVAPGVDGSAAFLLGGGSPGDGVVAFQLPITYDLGGSVLDVTTPENVAKAHAAGYAWHTWLSDDGESPATWTSLIDWCVDGVMTARPKAFERVLRGHPAPEACR